MITAFNATFSMADLGIDPYNTTNKIVNAIRDQVLRQLRRKGVVLGLSGGIDSSVTAALCVRALGSDRVLGLFMPERDSADESLSLGRLLAKTLGMDTVLENISDTLAGTGCYRRRDQAIRSIFPEYNPECKWKIALPSLFGETPYRVFSAVLQTADGSIRRKRMPLEVYQEIVAATNFKQRVRKMMEYYHADRLRYAVAGTPNLLEYDQGFFVKLGDGAADLKPISHLYKTQVYQLAEHLGIPVSIRRRAPTTDTYSLEQTQEEFFFSLPYDQMDACLYGKNHQIPCGVTAAVIERTPEQVERVYRDIDAKRQAAIYLHKRPLRLE
ncbi:MAG: NAD(+) synthase [Pirellulales bacterium]|nr:NAD(+) synthase [Pirellulales bacterium]